MKKITNECVGCKSMGLPCLGNTCPNIEVIRYYCDECSDETTLYDYHGEELCADCLLKKIKVIEGSEDW